MNTDTKKDYVGVKFDKSSRRGSRREWKTDKKEPKTLKHEGDVGAGVSTDKEPTNNKTKNQTKTQQKQRSDAHSYSGAESPLFRGLRGILTDVPKHICNFTIPEAEAGG